MKDKIIELALWYSDEMMNVESLYAEASEDEYVRVCQMKLRELVQRATELAEGEKDPTPAFKPYISERGWTEYEEV